MKRAIQQTTVSRRREEVRDDRREQDDGAHNFDTLSDDEMPGLNEQDLWYPTDDKAEYGATIGLREARKKLQHATKSRWLCKNGDSERERVTPNRSKIFQELVTRKIRALHRDTARDHLRVIDPVEAEGSENNWAQERGHRKAMARAKPMARQ